MVVVAVVTVVNYYFGQISSILDFPYTMFRQLDLLQSSDHDMGPLATATVERIWSP